MKLTRARLPSEKSLIGFVGGLWTLFVYAIEGSHSGGLVESKKRIGLWPDFVRIMGPLLRENIRRQLNAGAEVVMIFDTAAGEVAPGFYRRWMEAPLLEFAREFPGKIGYYSKGTREEFFSPEFLSAPWAGMGVDHRWTLASGLRMVRSGFVQGNFDQGLLHLPADGFRRELDAYFEPIARLSAEERAGWVCGLGHGVLPATPEENVRTFVRTAREVFR
jgi:uroporphyrinogen decarboxylase